MRPWTIDKDEEGSQPHRVYDLSIADINERREKSQVFATGNKCAQFLGMPANHISEIRGIGKQYFSKKHNKKFAIRIENKQSAPYLNRKRDLV